MPRPPRKPPTLPPPPREIPAEVKVRTLAHRDVLWGAPFFFVAASMALVVSPLDSDAFRIGMVYGAAAIFVLGLKVSIPRLLRGLRALSIMRGGVLAPARVVSCRLALGRKGKHVPYADFLSSWEDHLQEAVKPGSGFTRLFVMVFVVPFVLLLFVVAGSVAWRMSGDYPLDSTTSAYAMTWVAGGALTVIGTLLFLRFLLTFKERYGNRISAVKANLERLANDLTDLSYEEIARRIEDLAEGEVKPIKLKYPLPKPGTGLEIDCRVEFMAGGEARTAEGLAWLSNRLDPKGLEPLIHLPAHPTRMLLLAGLPEGVSLDPQGRWRADTAASQAVALGITAAAGTAALLGVLWQLPWLVGKLA